MRMYAACIECDWRSGRSKTRVSAKGAVRDGQAHHADTGHAVAVPTFTGRQRLIKSHQQLDATTPALGFAPAELPDLVELDE